MATAPAKYCSQDSNGQPSIDRHDPPQVEGARGRREDLRKIEPEAARPPPHSTQTEPRSRARTLGGTPQTGSAVFTSPERYHASPLSKLRVLPPERRPLQRAQNAPEKSRGPGHPLQNMPTQNRTKTKGRRRTGSRGDCAQPTTGTGGSTACPEPPTPGSTLRTDATAACCQTSRGVPLRSRGPPR